MLHAAKTNYIYHPPFWAEFFTKELHYDFINIFCGYLYSNISVLIVWNIVQCIIINFYQRIAFKACKLVKGYKYQYIIFIGILWTIKDSEILWDDMFYFIIGNWEILVIQYMTLMQMLDFILFFIHKVFYIFL